MMSRDLKSWVKQALHDNKKRKREKGPTKPILQVMTETASIMCRVSKCVAFVYKEARAITPLPYDSLLITHSSKVQYSTFRIV